MRKDLNIFRCCNIWGHRESWWGERVGVGGPLACQYTFDPALGNFSCTSWWVVLHWYYVVTRTEVRDRWRELRDWSVQRWLIGAFLDHLGREGVNKPHITKCWWHLKKTSSSSLDFGILFSVCVPARIFVATSFGTSAVYQFVHDWGWPYEYASTPTVARPQHAQECILVGPV